MDLVFGAILTDGCTMYELIQFTEQKVVICILEKSVNQGTISVAVQ